MRLKFFFLLFILTILFDKLTFAQQVTTVKTPFDDSKMFVVITVLVTIFVGIFLFLIYLNRKIISLENKFNHQNQYNGTKQ